MFYLETKRTFLREFNIYDLKDVYEYCSNPNVGPNAGWPIHKSMEETRGILINMIKNKENFAIVNKSNNKVIGSIGIYKDNKRDNEYCKMIGYVLNEVYWGKGIMSEVMREFIKFIFTNTQIMILSIYHFPSNYRSKRVIEKCGFFYEGILRKSTTMYNGAILDNVCYSLTREEFFKWLDTRR